MNIPIRIGMDTSKSVFQLPGVDENEVVVVRRQFRGAEAVHICNLYSMTNNVDAIRRLFRALNSRVGNLPSMPGIFPDYPAPIVRNAAEGREIVMARWASRHHRSR
jgi:hypothetical protein